MRIAAPPPRPTILYDGDCGFCAFWIKRWQRATGELVDYIPFAALEAQFPDLPAEKTRAAVHLVEPDGSVYSGAEAVFRALAKNSREHWLLDWYQHSPGFAAAAERVYRFVAGHRRFFSALTKFGWGRQLEPPRYERVRWVFLRGLGLIYLVAFVSLWVQLTGLIGEHGILPAQLTMAAVRDQTAAAHLGWDKFHVFPTLCWLDASDRFLKAQCAIGSAASVLLMLDFAPTACLVLLWLVYLSLTVIGRDFFGFQWDALLLETGLLAIFFAPLGGPKWWDRWRSKPPRQSPENTGPAALSLWLLRWLLFQLMFASGWVKLLSGDPTWRNFTALQYHYETQPLPTWIGWYAHQAPAWFQRGSTAAMFAIELALPIFIFGPRRFRQLACIGFVLLQLLIALTGNYCFFNVLTIALCVLLLDDGALQKTRVEFNANTAQLAQQSRSERFKNRLRSIQRLVAIPVACMFIIIPLLYFVQLFRVRMPVPGPIAHLYSWVAPFRSCNHYGLFAVMTINRLEIVVEGSNDGVTWQPYEFKYKPGPLNRRPRFVEPYQPRLDWQMWFAALGRYEENPWFVNFCVRLLDGAPDVVALLERNPFPDAPPRFVRALTYEYHFTDQPTRRRTADWWTRKLRGQYLPPISLRRQSERAP